MRIFCGNNERRGWRPWCQVRRWLRPTPDRLVLALLAPEGFLLLSERFEWFAFNEEKAHTLMIAGAVVGAAMLLMVLWFLSAIVFRWRFQFSIRSLLALALVVAIPCSWFAVERQRACSSAMQSLQSVHWAAMVATASAFCTITRLRPFRLGRGGRGAFSRRARRGRGACLESTSSPTRSKWATRSRMSTTARTGTGRAAPRLRMPNMGRGSEGWCGWSD